MAYMYICLGSWIAKKLTEEWSGGSFVARESIEFKKEKLRKVVLLFTSPDTYLGPF